MSAKTITTTTTASLNCTATSYRLRYAIVLSTVRDDGQPWGWREERQLWGAHLLTMSNTSLAEIVGTMPRPPSAKN